MMFQNIIKNIVACIIFFDILPKSGTYWFCEAHLRPRVNTIILSEIHIVGASSLTNSNYWIKPWSCELYLLKLHSNWSSIEYEPLVLEITAMKFSEFGRIPAHGGRPWSNDLRSWKIRLTKRIHQHGPNSGSADCTKGKVVDNNLTFWRCTEFSLLFVLLLILLALLHIETNNSWQVWCFNAWLSVQVGELTFID